MELERYRVEAGHYVVGNYTIYNGGHYWQVREGGIDNDCPDLLEQFPTLRQCIKYCQQN